MPVRILWAPQEELRLQRIPAHPLNEQDFGPAIGPHRPADRGSARRFRPTVVQAERNTKLV